MRPRDVVILLALALAYLVGAALLVFRVTSPGIVLVVGALVVHLALWFVASRRLSRGQAS